MSAPASEQKVEEKRKEKPSALRSVIAGATAGAVEICKCRLLLCWGWRRYLELETKRREEGRKKIRDGGWGRMCAEGACRRNKP